VVNPVPDVTKVGNGIEVHLFNSKRGIKILREGKQISEENMDDGPVSLVLFIKASNGGENYNIAVRFGTDADLYMAFAVIGNKVIKSPWFRNSAKGDNKIPAVWSSPNHLAIGGKQPNSFDFDPTLSKWIQARPNSPPSTQGGVSFGRGAIAVLTGGASEAARRTPNDIAEGLPINPRKTAENLDKILDRAARDTERAVAKAARDVGLTSSLSDEAAKRTVSDGAKRPPAADPTPPPDTASSDTKAVYVQTVYLKKAVEVVSTFETSNPDPNHAYLDVTLDSDGQGLTLGCFGWTIGTGDLQPLIRGPKDLPSVAREARRKLVEDAMPKFGKQFWEACNSPIPRGLEIVRSWQIVTGSNAKWRPDCKGVEAELKALLKTPEMWNAQGAAVVVKRRPAIKAANSWAQAMRGPSGIPTIREYTVFLETFVQNDGTKKKWTDDVNKLFGGPGTEHPVKTACTWLAGGTKGQDQYDQAKKNAEMWKKDFPEKYSKLFLLTWLIARESKPRYQRLVLSRRGTVLANNGYVNQTKWHFKQLEEDK